MAKEKLTKNLSRNSLTLITKIIKMYMIILVKLVATQLDKKLLAYTKIISNAIMRQK
jgi:hypothetical protein